MSFPWCLTWALRAGVLCQSRGISIPSPDKELCSAEIPLSPLTRALPRPLTAVDYSQPKCSLTTLNFQQMLHSVKSELCHFSP